jgi:hypothetical protein
MNHQKRVQPAFINPMQRKPVSVLPEGESWTFEIKFEGHRCIAVKRGREVTLFSRHGKALNKDFPKSWRRLHRLTVASFSTENLSPWIHKEYLHFNFCNILLRSMFHSIVTPFICYTKMRSSW